MPWSSVTRVTDADAFRGAIRPTNGEFLVTSRGSFSGQSAKVDLHRLRLQKFDQTLGYTWRVQIPEERAALAFSAGSQAPIKRNGVSLGDGQVAVLFPGSVVWVSRPGSGPTASLSLPKDACAELGIVLTGYDLRLSNTFMTATLPPPLLARLRRLHATAAHLAEIAPEILARPDAVTGLEASLTEAMIDCLTGGHERIDTAAQRRHATIMERLRALDEANEGRPIYLTEVCAAIGVTARTLHAICQQQMGMGPKRYLLLRRLHMAHRGLHEASAGHDSVTDIATRFGFFELGRFAVCYRSVFGETPSATLHHKALAASCSPSHSIPQRAKALRSGTV